MTILLLAVLLSANVQDAETRALMRLEDEWASAMVKRDSVVFNRLLAPGFVYTENDQMMDRAAVLHSVLAGPDTVTTAHHEEMLAHRYRSVPTRVADRRLGGRGAGVGMFRSPELTPDREPRDLDRGLARRVGQCVRR